MCLVSKHALCCWSGPCRGPTPLKEHHLNCPDLKLYFQDWKHEAWTWARTGQHKQDLLWSAAKAPSSSAKHIHAAVMLLSCESIALTRQCLSMQISNCSAPCQIMTPELDPTRWLFCCSKYVQRLSLFRACILVINSIICLLLENWIHVIKRNFTYQILMQKFWYECFCKMQKWKMQSIW